MLYKVTPMMVPAPGKAKKARDAGAPRKRRKSAVYDADGHEVLITLMCLKCHSIKPLMQFGLRKMADGAIRNQPWCRTCRAGAGAPAPKGKGAKAEGEEVELEAADAQEAAPQPAPADPNDPLGGAP
jgi:hypothetical protein